MATDLDASYSETYNNINTKLKKRFMRKPNISEATNEFIGLAIQCENAEQPTFAGQTYIGAAKCEGLAGNPLGEAAHYITAARQFMKAEKKLASLKFESLERENLEAAIGCFLQALQKYPEKSPLRTSIFMEIANDLLELDFKLEAIAYYEQALETIEEDLLKAAAMNKLLNMQIDAGKLDLALATGNAILELKCKIPEQILKEVQVSRVLLALTEEVSTKNKTESLEKLLKDISNDEENDSMPFGVDLKLKLQSIIMCCESTDQQGLIDIYVDTKPHLTLQQLELLDTIIDSKGPF